MISGILSALFLISSIAFTSINILNPITKNDDFINSYHNRSAESMNLSVSDDDGEFICDFYCYDFDATDRNALNFVQHTTYDTSMIFSNNYDLISFYNTNAPKNGNYQFAMVIALAHFLSDIDYIYCIPYFSDYFIDYRCSISITNNYVDTNIKNLFFTSTSNFNFLNYERLAPFNYWDYIQNPKNGNYNVINSFAVYTTDDDNLSINFNIPILQYNNYDVISNSYQNGYNDGYSDGYDVGNNDGYGLGRSEGYASGYQAGVNSFNTEGLELNLINLLGGIADTPVRIIVSLFNFDFFGISALTIFMSLMTGIIVLWFIKKIIHK